MKHGLIMLGYGDLVQKSVFECRLDDKQREKMQDRVRAVLNTAHDTVRVYRLCRACSREREALGQGEIAEEVDVFIV